MPKNLFIFNSSQNKILELFKKYRAIVLAVILFLLAQFFFLAYADVSQVGSKQVVKEKRYWAKSNNFIKEKEGAATVLFMGNSRIASGIIPEVFDQENDYLTHSYNLSLVGLQAPPHYFMLKDYLKQHKPPEFIIIDPTEEGYQVESFPSYAVQGARLYEVIAYAYYRKNIDVLLNYIIPSRLHWPEVTRYFLGKIIQLMPNDIKNKHREIYMKRFSGKEVYGHNRKYFYESQYVDPEGYMKRSLAMLRKERGYYFIIEQAVENNRITEEYLKVIYPVDYKKYLKRKNDNISQHDNLKDIILNKDIEGIIISPIADKFLKLTKKYNIKIILMQAYVSKFLKSEEHYPDQWIAIQKKYDHVFTLKKMSGISKYDYKYFSDPAHLNRQGAVKHTKRVAEGFKELIEELKTIE